MHQPKLWPPFGIQLLLAYRQTAVFCWTNSYLRDMDSTVGEAVRYSTQGDLDERFSWGEIWGEFDHYFRVCCDPPPKKKTLGMNRKQA